MNKWPKICVLSFFVTTQVDLSLERLWSDENELLINKN